jgi:hypothetical protein
MFLNTCHIIGICVINLNYFLIYGCKCYTSTFFLNFDFLGLAYFTWAALYDYICEQILEECTHYDGLWTDVPRREIHPNGETECIRQTDVVHGLFQVLTLNDNFHNNRKIRNTKTHHCDSVIYSMDCRYILHVKRNSPQSHYKEQSAKSTLRQIFRLWYISIHFVSHAQTDIRTYKPLFLQFFFFLREIAKRDWAYYWTAEVARLLNFVRYGVLMKHEALCCLETSIVCAWWKEAEPVWIA